MIRWGNEAWKSHVERGDYAPSDDDVAIFTATIDVDIVHAELRFNERLSPNQILEALGVSVFGSFSFAPWPPLGCNDGNRFRLMALNKILIFLAVAESIERDRPGARPYSPDDLIETPRAWAYQRFPEAR